MPSASTRSAATHVGGAVAVGQVAAESTHVVAASTSSSVIGGKPSASKTAWIARAAALAHGERVVLVERLDAGVDLPVALQRQPLVEVVGVVVAAAEHVVVARHRRSSPR